MQRPAERARKPATATVSRPPDSRSIEASACAACTGPRSTGISAAVPMVTREVAGVIAASIVSASILGLSSESLTHSES